MAARAPVLNGSDLAMKTATPATIRTELNQPIIGAISYGSERSRIAIRRGTRDRYPAYGSTSDPSGSCQAPR